MLRTEYEANQTLAAQRQPAAWEKPAPKRTRRIVRQCWILRLLGVRP